MKGLLAQPTEVLCRVVHYLSPQDIDAFTSTHSLLRTVGAQALAVHCEKKQRFSHLELACNETIHPLDLISALLEHEENPEYIKSLSVGPPDADFSKESKTSSTEIVHLLTKYPNLKAKVEHLMKATAVAGSMETFPTSEDWKDFPHLYGSSHGGCLEDFMYFIISMSPNLGLLRLVDAPDSDFTPLEYLTRAPMGYTPISLLKLREIRLHKTWVVQCSAFLDGNESVEVLKAQNVFDGSTSDDPNDGSTSDNPDDANPLWLHPALHTIVLQRSAVSAEGLDEILHVTKSLRSFTFCYDTYGKPEVPEWEPQKTLAILKDTACNCLVHLDLTNRMKDMSACYAISGLGSDISLLRDFKVLRTLRLEALLLFKAKIKKGTSLAKRSLSTKKALKLNFEMDALDVQQLRDFLPKSAAKVSLVGHMYRADVAAATKGLTELKQRAPAFSELVLEEIEGRQAAEMRQAVQAECQNAKVSLRVFPTRLDAPLEEWWEAKS